MTCNIFPIILAASLIATASSGQTTSNPQSRTPMPSNTGQFFLMGTITGHDTGLVLQYNNSLANVPLDSAKAIYASFSPEVKNSNFGRVVNQEFLDHEASAHSHLAVDFTRMDLRGCTISLSDFKDKKYVLLDFWGSWSAPCRELSPRIRNLYARYKNRGLEVIGISADTDMDKWKRAVAKDSTGVYTNIASNLNGNYPYNEIEKKFGLAAWPTLILIDQQGVIVGRYAGGEELPVEALEKVLQDIFSPAPLPKKPAGNKKPFSAPAIL